MDLETDKFGGLIVKSHILRGTKAKEGSKTRVSHVVVPTSLLAT